MNRKKTNAVFCAEDVLFAVRSVLRLLSLGMAVVIAVYLTSGITVVAPNEVGVLLRFGKVVSRAHPPGLLFALPAPIDQVIKVPLKSVQEVPLDLWAASGRDDSVSLNPVTQPYTLTGDANIVRASFVVRYQISDAADYALNVRERNAVRDAILYQAACRVLSSMSVEDAMTSGKNYIGAEAARLAQAEMNSLNMGIHLLAFETREITPPAAVSPAFQAVVSAKVQAKTMLDEANAYAASQIPGAKAEAYRVRQEAEAYRKQVVSKAQGESSAFTSLLAQYRANPLLVRARLQGEMLSIVLPAAKLSTATPGGSQTKVFLAPQAGKFTPVPLNQGNEPYFGVHDPSP